LLLLGAGESGKSTVAKQMKIIHKEGFTTEELKGFVNVIHTNVYQSCKTLLQAGADLGLDVKDESLLPHFEPGFVEKITPELGDIIKKFWQDEGVQDIYKRRCEFQLTDSTDYYLSEITRISAPDYLPTVQDVLRSRVQTTGIIETEFFVDGTKFILVDVGGQRSERKKWMYCFEDVTAVLFVVALSGFDLTLYEDRKTNRMHESLKLFHEICISKWFTKAAMILFLNKSDLFKTKLENGASLKTAFPDYKGDNSFKDASEFIREKFVDVCDPLTNKPKDIYPHFTCATDTDNVKHVFEAVKDFLLHQALNTSGIGM